MKQNWTYSTSTSYKEVKQLIRTSLQQTTRYLLGITLNSITHMPHDTFNFIIM